MTGPANALIDPAALRALAQRPLETGLKGVPPHWWGRTPAELIADAPQLSAAGVFGPVCVLHAAALAHNITTMAGWCRERGVELAPHGKTHMAPQLAARQLAAGACAVTVATVGQAAVYRAFGVTNLVLANQLVDEAGLRWLGRELDADPDLQVLCWVDSGRGVEVMTAALADTQRPVDVCVEVGLPGGRTGCRTDAEVDAVARAAAASPRLRLVGVAGYEAALGHGRAPDALAGVRAHLAQVRAAVLRLAPVFETDLPVASAGGSSYFDEVADTLTDWPGALAVRTVLRSGCYLTHDHGLYARTSPLTDRLRPALEIRAQVVSRPEPNLAVLTMGRRDVAFDQDLPVPLDLPDSSVAKLNDQHAYLRLGGADRAAVGDWLRFGISHPCTVFDKWRIFPEVDAAGRLVDLIRTYF
ncbi:amino acid deaminase [Mycolicibacterium duvalii]|uniref:Amino acid deaminase n=1 Tax=Mycolicibacterium duvalii TaxID=39688 RepID=A0A7I7K9E0_9MYCO|nr:alanine racemase [Mycolicibacterium duvalii]MCV7371071.1 alanine racemase [Mycolicibacterium duvalii]PEG37153.1 amino acid deaminase [Mycolicibacterium duvalii]BBX20002.1 amino acid deaminase [Mycolicibacterium duvalii]